MRIGKRKEDQRKEELTCWYLNVFAALLLQYALACEDSTHAMNIIACYDES